MTHHTKNFNHLVGKLPGFSAEQLEAHFELYRGYVKKINEIENLIAKAKLDEANYSYAEISELYRRKSVPFNGAYLHELFFENLTAERTDPSSVLLEMLTEDYGSLEDWYKYTQAALKSVNGWALLTYSHVNRALCTVALEEHHRGMLVEQTILLAVDGWEHAYAIDYGIAKDKYYQAVKKCLDWNVASDRLDAAISQARVAA
ncbi:MAG: superoxide dismutase [Bacteriovoracia bacterium]